MDVVIIILQVFLILAGVVSIIRSLIDLGESIKESESSVETKWFKWKAPVRLVFGLICIIIVILINKIDFFSVDNYEREALKESVESLEKENEELRKIISKNDSLSDYYILHIDEDMAESIFNGKVLLTFDYNKLQINGAEILNPEQRNVRGDKISIKTGEKYYIKFKGVVWGINILHANVNSSYTKLEVFQTDPTDK